MATYVMGLFRGSAMAFFAAVAAGLAAAPASAGSAERQVCVEVQIGGTRTLDYTCLTENLEKGMHTFAPAINNAPIGPASSPHQVGTFNQAATKQLLGSSFGRSAIPQRPQQTFSVPLVNGGISGR